MSDMKILKINYNGEIRRAQLPSSFEELQNLIMKTFNFTTFEGVGMYYKDDEGDSVRIHSEYDLEQAKHFLKGVNADTLKLEIRDMVKKTDSLANVCEQKAEVLEELIDTKEKPKEKEKEKEIVPEKAAENNNKCIKINITSDAPNQYRYKVEKLNPEEAVKEYKKMVGEFDSQFKKMNTLFNKFHNVFGHRALDSCFNKPHFALDFWEPDEIFGWPLNHKKQITNEKKKEKLEVKNTEQNQQEKIEEKAEKKEEIPNDIEITQLSASGDELQTEKKEEKPVCEEKMEQKKETEEKKQKQPQKKYKKVQVTDNDIRVLRNLRNLYDLRNYTNNQLLRSIAKANGNIDDVFFYLI